MTQYDQTFAIPQAFPPFSLARILAEVLAEQGKTQFRTAETEKYPHVTYFFNGGYEPPYPGEERCLIPSQRVATYDLAPEMSAAGITDALCRAVEAGRHDFLLCNYANADMVGHTGVLPAVIRAVETVDRCLERVLASADQAGCRVLITADHGNCEMMIDPTTGGVHTAHTTNPVPLVAIGAGPSALRAGGSLRDVAPTVLGLLGIEPPAEMTGRDLREWTDGDYRVRLAVVLLLALAGATSAAAQVGHDPQLDTVSRHRPRATPSPRSAGTSSGTAAGSASLRTTARSAESATRSGTRAASRWGCRSSTATSTG